MSSNENAVRRALKTLIDDNKATFVTGITHHGVARSINQITTSMLTPPQDYYFVSIAILDVRIQTRRDFGGGVSLPPTEAQYDVVIELSDYAISTAGEDQPYETMDSDFQLLGDRIIDKIRESRWITDSVSDQKFRLEEERLVNKSNLTSTWEDSAQYHAMLYSRITFTLIEECTDSSDLY